MLRYKPFKENVDKTFVSWQEVSVHPYCLGHTNWSEFVGDIYFIFSLRGHSKYPPSQLEEIPADSLRQCRMKTGKVKVREVLYPANLMGLIV